MISSRSPYATRLMANVEKMKTPFIVCGEDLYLSWYNRAVSDASNKAIRSDTASLYDKTLSYLCIRRGLQLILFSVDIPGYIHAN